MNQTAVLSSYFTRAPLQLRPWIMFGCVTSFGLLWQRFAFEISIEAFLSQFQLLLIALLAHRLSWLCFFELNVSPSTQSHTQRYMGHLSTAITLSYGIDALLLPTLSFMEPQPWLRFVEVLLGSVLIHELLITLQILTFFPPEPQVNPQHEQIEIEYKKTNCSIPLKDFVAIQVQDHYCTLHIQEGLKIKQFVVYGKLADFETRLEGYLVRINRSVLVKPSTIESISSGRNPALRVRGIESSFTVSRARKADIVKLSS